jgi:3-hydroxy-9,10-secoandrosta-1,3,5(10)-triene-9,17-dione monooxygenase reductase component
MDDSPIGSIRGDATRGVFKDVLSGFATGVVVATAVHEGAPSGVTLQSFCALSLEPPLVLLCPSLTSTTWPKISAVGRLCINLLADDQEEVARVFSRSGADRFAGIAWRPSPAAAAPIIDGALGWIDAAIESETVAGDHLIAVCRVIALERRSARDPLIFYDRSFLRLGTLAG